MSSPHIEACEAIKLDSGVCVGLWTSGLDGDVGLRDVLFFSQGLRTYQPPTAAVAKLINFDSTCVELCRA